MRNRLILIASFAWILAATPMLSAADSTTKTRTTETKAKATAKVDINHADAATLEQLPGIGPATAQAIIAARPFSSVDDLERVSGIGPAKLADLRDQVVVRVDRGEKKSERASRTAKSDSAPAKSKAASTAKGGTAAHAGKIDVNTADAATLETLPGVGPVIARAIVAGRPYTAVDDLARVPGIGEQRLAELRDHVIASRAAAQHRTTQDRALAPTGRINLNKATREELEALPEIGPVKAQAIIDARPFSSVEDIMRVKGIKQGTFDVIKDRITVR